MSRSLILSSKLTSTNYQESSLSGFLDKIKLNSRSLDLKVDELIKELVVNKISHETGQFRSRENYLKVLTKSNSPVYLTFNWATKQITNIILNPSTYSKYECFILDVSDCILTRGILESLPINRLDKTIDIASHPIEIYRGLEVKFKRIATAYGLESGLMTGLQLGKGQEIIKVYHKSRRSQLPFDCTRIEIACTGKKIQFTCLKEMVAFWRHESKLRDSSFMNIQLNTFLKTSNCKKAYELEVLTTNLAYSVAKQMLNKNGNFHRDYKNRHTLTPLNNQPDNIFNEGMRIFFNSDDPGAKNE